MRKGKSQEARGKRQRQKARDKETNARDKCNRQMQKARGKRQETKAKGKRQRDKCKRQKTNARGKRQMQEARGKRQMQEARWTPKAGCELPTRRAQIRRQMILLQNVWKCLNCFWGQTEKNYGWYKSPGRETWERTTLGKWCPCRRFVREI